MFVGNDVIFTKHWVRTLSTATSAEKVRERTRQFKKQV